MGRVVSARSATTAPVLPPRADTTTLPDGRTLTQGQEFTLIGGGRYRFAYEFRLDGSVTCWGPIGSKQIEGNANWRSFKPDQIRTIHRSKGGE